MKKLNILLGNNTLSLLAGSETWTLTLARQLKEMGHKVSCYSPELGVISDKLINEDIHCFKELYSSGVKPFNFILEEAHDHNYDVIIANHWHIVENLRNQFPKTPIISTIHGIIHRNDFGYKAPEHPALESGVNQFISVSEEVKEKLIVDYGVDSEIIRNFFDIKRLGSLKPSHKEGPKQFLINTNYSDRNDDFVLAIKEAAKHYGAKVAAIGQNFSQTIDITRAIEDSDVVFGMGRSVLEGVAAGRLGIVLGRWGLGGAITEGSVEELRYFNFSGRNSTNEPITAEKIIELIDRHYNQMNFDWGKKYMAENHNVVFAAEKYIQIARELTGESINSQLNVGPVASDTKPFKLAKNA